MNRGSCSIHSKRRWITGELAIAQYRLFQEMWDIVSGESHETIQNRNEISPPTPTPMTEQGQENHPARGGNFEH